MEGKVHRSNWGEGGDRRRGNNPTVSPLLSASSLPTCTCTDGSGMCEIYLSTYLSTEENNRTLTNHALRAKYGTCHTRRARLLICANTRGWAYSVLQQISQDVQFLRHQVPAAQC